MNDQAAHGPGSADEHPRDDPTLALVAAHITVRRRVLGYPVRIETNDARVVESLGTAFGPGLPAEPATDDAVVRVLTHAVAEEPGFSPRQPLIRRQGELFSIVAGRATAVSGDARSGFAFGFVSDEAATHEAFLREGVVMGAAFCLLAPRFVTVVHAGCVARDGRALLLRGDSGAGKTTLTYAAVRRGYQLLAEDATYVLDARAGATGPLSNALRLRGVPWSMHLLSDARELFPELADEPVRERLSGERKLRVDIAARFPGRAAEEAALGPTVFVARGPGGSPRLTKLPRADALARLDATAIYEERLVARERGLWDAFLARPAYLLETGDDPEANAAMLDEIGDLA